MKKIFTVFLIVIILLFVVSVAKDLAIKSVVSVVATQVTGAKVSIGWFSLGILKQSVRIRDFKMYNPAGFPQGILVDIPKISVDYDLLSLLKGKLHLRLLEIDLKEIGLEKNKEGKLNVDALKVAQQPQKEEPAKEKKDALQLAIQIDVANLKMGKIVMKDYGVAPEPAVQVYDINLEKTYKNITSAQQLVALILTEPMKAAGIKGAGIYGVALLTGVGFIPVAIAATFAQKDSVQQELSIPIDKLYNASLEVLKRIGKINKEDKTAATINAEVSGAGITLKLKSVSAKNTQITISARKLGLPKPEIASGVLYQISEKIK